MDNEFRHTGVYRGMAPLSREAIAYMAVQDNPFLAEMMQRQDSRKWEQDQAIAAARALPKFSPAPTGGSPQIGYQNQMRIDAENMIRSENPTVQKQGFAMLDIVNKDLSSNFVETQDQKNAYSAAPNNPQGFQELIAKMVDPGYALNLAHRNKMTEMGAEYGNKRGFEQLQFGNKKDLAGFEQGLKGFGTAPMATGGTAMTKQGKMTNADRGQIILDTLNTPIENKTVDDLLKESTSSGIGENVDKFNRYFGATTQSAQAASQLETLSGWLTSVMPRMEGPQSNYDVENYKIMAGKIGDRTVPYEEKKKALDVVIALAKKYSGAPPSNFQNEKPTNETPMTFKSEAEFNDYATKNNLTKEQFIQEYQKHFGGQ